MPEKSKSNETFKDLLIKPEVTNTLAILSGLSFLLMGMLLPLVGKAGAVTDHYMANFITFAFVVLIASALSAMNFYARIERRKQDGSPYPKQSLALCIACAVILVSLFTGLLKI